MDAGGKRGIGVNPAPLNIEAPRLEIVFRAVVYFFKLFYLKNFI